MMKQDIQNNQYCYRYPHPALTVDCVIFGFDGQCLKILLVERGLEPYKGMWALPGGFVRIDETVELMLEVVLSKRPYIRIAGDDFPREVVKSRFLKINSGHLEYVFDCIDKNTTKVGNIKAYLLAALYNAPATMDSYYRAEVNHDLYGC